MDKTESKDHHGKIKVKLLRDNQNWLVNKIASSENEGEEIDIQDKRKSARNAEVLISIPLSRIPNCLKKLADMNSFRPPSRFNNPARFPLAPAPNATKLKTYRHPVPTNTVRTIMIDKLDNGLTQTSKTSTVDRIVPAQVYPRDLFHIKHRLPIAAAPVNTSTKLSYIAVPDDIPPHHNDITNPIVPTTAVVSTQTEETQDSSTAKAEASVQTEKMFMIIEEDFKLFQIVKTLNITEKDIQLLETIRLSGVKEDDLVKQISKMKKRKEFNDVSDCLVIDLENDVEDTPLNTENLEILLEQSKRNKYLLLSRYAAMSHASLSAVSQQPLHPQGTSSPDNTHVTSPMQSPQALTPETYSASSLESLPTNALDCSLNSKTPAGIENCFQPTVIYNDKTPTQINSAFAKAPTTTEEFHRFSGSCSDLISQTAMTPTALQAPSPAKSYTEMTQSIMASLRKSRARSDTAETLSTASVTRTEETEANRKRKATPDHDMDITRHKAHNKSQKSPTQAFGGKAKPSFLQEWLQNEAVVQQQQQQKELRTKGQYVQLARKMQQQNAQYAQMRNQQLPYDYGQDRLASLNSPQMAQQQLQLPPHVQLLYPREQRWQPLPSASQTQPKLPPEHLYSTEQGQFAVASSPQPQAQPIPLPKHPYSSEQKQLTMPKTPLYQCPPLPPPEHPYPSGRRQLTMPTTPLPQGPPLTPSEHQYPRGQKQMTMPTTPLPQGPPLPPTEHPYPTDQRQLTMTTTPLPQCPPLPPPEHSYPSGQLTIPRTPLPQGPPLPPTEHPYPTDQRQLTMPTTPLPQCPPLPPPEHLYPSGQLTIPRTPLPQVPLLPPPPPPEHPYPGDQRQLTMPRTPLPQGPPLPLPEQPHPSEQIRPPALIHPQSKPQPPIPVEPPRHVFSTEMANIRGAAIQRGRNWHYPLGYDRHGNYWPRRPDLGGN